MERLTLKRKNSEVTETRQVECLPNPINTDDSCDMKLEILPELFDILRDCKIFCVSGYLS